MSPEQVEGKSRDITPRTDVWALGAMLYETLAGAPPFIGETHLEIYQKISRLDPPPQQSMPRDLETVALKALEKDPARRYPSAREFADDLRRYLDGQAIAARRPPPWVRAWTRLSRRRAVIVVVVALLAAGAWVGAHQWRQAAKSRLMLTQAAEDERLGRFQEARDGYRLARELEPSSGEALLGLQRTEEELTRRRQALLEQAKLQEEAVRFMKPSRIETVVGKVKLVTEFTRDNAQAGQNLLPGNGLETIGPESFARIKYLNVAVMELDGETLIHQWLEESAAGGTKAVSVKRGALRVSIPSALPGRPLMFSTPHLDVQSAPASFRLIVTPRSTRLLVERGALRATRRADGVAVLVEQGLGLECGTKGLMAPEPLAAPGGRLIADFESHLESDWVPGVQSPKGTLALSTSRPGLQGSGSLKMQYSVPATEMVWASGNYAAPQDWSGYSGLSFWFNGAKAGSEIFVEVLENVEPNQPGRNNERFWYGFKDDFAGWKKFDVIWAQFKRRSFPNSPNDGFTRKEVWGMSLIVIAPDVVRRAVAEFDQIELMGPVPVVSEEPWKPIFDGKTLDGFVREGPATWRVENGALVRDPAVQESNAMQTSLKFGDAEIRIRFDLVQDLQYIWFAARQGADGNYSVGWSNDEVLNLKGRPHELIFVCRGESVSATLDGKSVPIEAQGRPRTGALQFDTTGTGLRIFSIEQRSIRP
jgi:hypothetical protein